MTEEKPIRNVGPLPDLPVEPLLVEPKEEPMLGAFMINLSKKDSEGFTTHTASKEVREAIKTAEDQANLIIEAETLRSVKFLFLSFLSGILFGVTITTIAYFFQGLLK